MRADALTILTNTGDTSLCRTKQGFHVLAIHSRSQSSRMKLDTSNLSDLARVVAGTLLRYCLRERWLGFDPYDILNSPLLRRNPLFNSSIFRVLATQLMKRSPINFRPLLRVPKTENPKGCALACSSLVSLSQLGLIADNSLLVERIGTLLRLRSTYSTYSCWGYNFDWQSRNFLVPAYTPNVICTTFAGNALLDAHQVLRDPSLINIAQSTADFIIKGLNIYRENGGQCFSYTPLDHARVHNANLLAAAFLVRLSRLTGRTELGVSGELAVRYSLSKQNPDGSWWYGEDPSQHWIDNFHTGYNLIALRHVSEIILDNRIRYALKRGFKFYIEHFFGRNSAPRYYHNRTWPVDVHSVAQSIITLCELAELDKRADRHVRNVFIWAIRNLADRRGFFYYQKHMLFLNRIPYLRWGQLWMLLALSKLIAYLNGNCSAVP